MVVAATDLDGGISYLSLGSIDVFPIPNTFVATPAPDLATQVDDPASPNVTYPNPETSPDSHAVEVTYYTGGNPPGRPRGFATLEAKFNLGSVSVAHLSVRAQNTSVSAASSYMDAYFVRPARRDASAGIGVHATSADLVDTSTQGWTTGLGRF